MSYGPELIALIGQQAYDELAAALRRAAQARPGRRASGDGAAAAAAQTSNL